MLAARCSFTWQKVFLVSLNEKNWITSTMSERTSVWKPETCVLLIAKASILIWNRNSVKKNKNMGRMIYYLWNGYLDVPLDILNGHFSIVKGIDHIVELSDQSIRFLNFMELPYVGQI